MDNSKEQPREYNSLMQRSSKKEIDGYIQIREPEPDRDLRYSPLFDCIMCSIGDRLNEFTDKETFRKVWSESMFPERLAKQILRIIEQHSNHEPN